MVYNIRVWVTALLLAGGTAFAVGCGSDGGPVGGDPDAGDATGDTDAPSLDVDVDETGPGTDTDTGNGTCANVCVRSQDCPSGSGQICEDGCCVAPSNGGDVCRSPLAPCTSAAQSTDNFICDPNVGLCMQRCVDADTEDTRGRNCPLGSFCVEGNDPREDPTTGVVRDGFCLPGDCDGSLFDADACAGVDSILAPGTVCQADTCTCRPLANSASFCFPAGTAQLGETCGTSGGENPPITDICAGGLICFEQECIRPCNLQDGSAACTGPAAATCPAQGDCECLPAFDTTARNQPGLCGVSCEPFSIGQCPDDMACLFASGRFGINAWLCQDLPEGDLAGPGDACGDGTSAVCMEGLLCIAESEGGPQSCRAYCDPLGESTGAAATCQGDAVGDEVISAVAFTEASDYLSMEAGTVNLEVRSGDGSSLIDRISVDFVAGEVHTIVAAQDEDGDLDFFVAEELFDGDDLPETGVRGIHAAGDAGNVDLYLGFGTIGATYSSDLGTVEVPEGDYATLATRGDSTLASGSTEVEDGELLTLVYSNLSDNRMISAHTATLIETDGDAAVRFFHGAPGANAVKVFVDCPAADVGEPEFSNCNDPIASNASPTSTGSLSFSTVEPGAAFVLIFNQTDDLTDEGTEPIFQGTVMLEADSYTTLAAILVDGDLELVPYEHNITDLDAAYLTFLHSALAAGGPLSMSAELQTPVVEDLAYGEFAGGTDSSYIALEPGTYLINVRAAGADADDAPAISTGLFELDPGLVTLVAAGSAVNETLTGFFVADDPATPDDGEGTVRVLHAASAAGSVAVYTVADSGQVCAPTAIDGFGLCNEGCDAWPRTGGGGYGCTDDSDTCFPILTRRDRPVVGQGVCLEDDGTVDPGGTCNNPGFLGGQCKDFAVCLADSAEAASGECFALCEPFIVDGNQCGSGLACSPVPPLLGQLNFSFCTDVNPGNDAGAFETCSEEGLPCSADGTICLNVVAAGAQPVCLPVCRQGFDDCTDFEGRTCRTGQLNPDVVPTFMGLCQ